MATTDAVTIGTTTGTEEPPHPSDDGGFINFLREHIWVPILVALAVLVIFAAIIVFIVYKCRKNRQYDYTALHEDMALPNKMELQKHQEQDAIRDAALLNCSFYLRSSGMYSLIDHLPEIGSRIIKHWFLVRDTHSKAEKLLTMVPRAQQMALPFSNATKKTLNELFPQLEHPYIYPIHQLDMTLQQEQIVIVQPFNNAGSLKDFIYRSHCCDHWMGKYNFRTKGLPIKQVREFGLHILHGILFLEERGFPVYGHLHSGNILVQDYVCRLSAHENVLLGFTSKMEPVLQSLLKENRGAIDTLCFGHLLFEMTAGFELNTPRPSLNHLEFIQDPQLLQLLNFIFSPEKNFPTIREISEHQFFQGVALEDLETYVRKPVYMSTAMKNLFKMIRRGYPSSSKKLKKKKDSISMETETSLTLKPPVPERKRRNSKSSITSKDGEKKSKSKSSTRKKSKSKTTGKPEEDSISQTSVPEEATTSQGQFSGNPERNALLAEIKKGVTLRHSKD